LDADEEQPVTLISRFKRKPEPESGSPQRDLAALTTERSTRRDYALILTQPGEQRDAAELERAWKQLGKEMALVPEGEVMLLGTDPESFADTSNLCASEAAWVSAVYVDRFCVTNEQFAEFVAAGGYGLEHLWPAEILSNVLQFVDTTGNPGPRYWVDGHPVAKLRQHPVTGICWYEANAYAHWRGKRLPSPAEWQRATVWAGGHGGGCSQRRYPWGDAYDPSRCNTWNSGRVTTVPVDEYYSGCTPNGIYQLIGNVWEWTAALFESEDGANGDRVLTEYPLAEIRGGAFDTYFTSQATAQFRTGQALLFRGMNVGFRCCIGSDQLAAPTDPFSFLDDEAKS
jgi:iron(II)-dependent oxidoreductase